MPIPSWGLPVPVQQVGSGLPGWMLSGAPGWALPTLQPLYGSGVPADALGVLGQTYYDTVGGKWYRKRWVGNFLNDSVTIPVVGPANGTTDSWDAELMLKGVFTTAVSNDSIFAHIQSGGLGHTRLQKDNSVNVPFMKARASDGSTFATANPGSSPINDNAWHRIRFGVRGSVCYIQVGNDAEATASLAGWTPGVAVSTLLTDTLPATDESFSICDLRMSRPGGLLYSIPMSDGSGSVVRDASGNGYHGTITDGAPNTFWLQTWVPIL